MAIDEQTPAGQWAELWAVYMRENRALTARAEAAEQRAEALAAEVARLRAVIAEAAADLPAPGDVVGTMTCRSVAEQARTALLAALAEAQPAGEVSNG